MHAEGRHEPRGDNGTRRGDAPLTALRWNRAPMIAAVRRLPDEPLLFTSDALRMVEPGLPDHRMDGTCSRNRPAMAPASEDDGSDCFLVHRRDFPVTFGKPDSEDLLHDGGAETRVAPCEILILGR